MSKKTRKKSSKPAPKSRKTPARKPAAAKTARKTARRSDKTPAKKPAAEGGQQDRPKPPPRRPSANPTRRPKPLRQSVAQAAIETVKIRSIGAAQTGCGEPTLVEGAQAPAFSLPRDGGGNVSLADYAGKKLVLFFYPRADTPGCTREAIDFTRLKGAFADEGAAVLGVSADTVKAQESFRNKHQLAVPLISDEQHEMLEAYGAWGEKSMYGRKLHGNYSDDGSDRRRRADRQDLAQCPGRRPCRRGAGRASRAYEQ